MKPVLQALLVADHVYIDKVTGKKVVAGIFHRLWFKKAQRVPEINAEQGTIKIEIPASGHQSGSPFCYISLTELRGKQPLALRYVRLDDYKVIFRTEFTIECQNPLETIAIVFPLPVLPTHTPGIFALELLWNEEPLGSHRLIVEELKEGE